MSSKPVRRPGELAFTMVLVVFSLAALWQAYGISGFEGLSTAGIFPMLATATMVVSAIVIFGRAVRTPAADRQQGPELLRFLREVTPLRHGLLLGLIVLYLATMPWLGFVVSSGLFLFACFWSLWRRGLLISLATTAGALAVIYFVFRVVFQVVLPQGSLFRGLI